MRPSILTLLLVAVGVLIGVLAPTLAGWMSHTTHLLHKQLTLDTIMRRTRLCVVLIFIGAGASALLIILPYGQPIAWWGTLTVIALVVNSFVVAVCLTAAIESEHRSPIHSTMATVTDINRSQVG